MAKETKTKALAIVALTLSIVTALGVAGMGFKQYRDAHPKEEEKHEQEDKKDSGGAIVTPEDDDEASSPLSFVTKKLARAEYDEYGIEPYADSAFQIKVSYTGTVDYKDVNWSIAWKSGASGQWGNGKTVTEYVSGSASSDTLTYTVTCHQAFGEQIIITATNKVNPDVTKSATCDYERRVIDVVDALYHVEAGEAKGVVMWNSVDITTGYSSAIDRGESKPDFQYSDVYTIASNNDPYISVSLNSEFVTKLLDYASTSSYFVGDTKTALEELRNAKTNVDSKNIDLTKFVSIISLFTSSGASNKICTDETVRKNAATIFAGFLASGSQPYFLELNYNATGYNSSYTKTVQIGYASGAFGSVANASSMNFDKTGFIF